jgi:hypothetical protein
MPDEVDRVEGSLQESVRGPISYSLGLRQRQLVLSAIFQPEMPRLEYSLGSFP